MSDHFDLGRSGRKARLLSGALALGLVGALLAACETPGPVPVETVPVTGADGAELPAPATADLGRESGTEAEGGTQDESPAPGSELPGRGEIQGGSEDPASAAPTADIVRVKTEIVASDPARVSLAAGRPQMIEFFAHWCGTCQMMAPIVHELEAEYADRMVFSYLDIDDPATDDLKSALGYSYQPHYFLLDAEGRLVESWQGPVSRDKFATAFDALLAQ